MTGFVITPAELGLPEYIAEFRDAQVEALEFALTSENRFVGIGAPPGVGKSALAYALAKILGGRTVILTATLGLQDQYVGAGFKALTDIRGRSNYACWEGGNCEDGARLACKQKIDCPYMLKFRQQDASELVVTSYAYWLSVHAKSNGLREADTLILDEAHLAPEWLGWALDFHFTERELRQLGCKQQLGDDWQDWLQVAGDLSQAALALYDSLKSRARAGSRDQLAKELRLAESLCERTSRLTSLDDNWVVERSEGEDQGRTWRFNCIWPGKYREWLFQRCERVVLMSATLRPKLFGLLGIKRADVDFKEWDRQFPAVNGPVIWVPTVRVNRHLNAEDRQVWLARHSEITDARSDRNGLIHTVSYVRAKEVDDYLGSRCILNGAADADSATARQAFDRFSQAAPGSILCSPSFSTGWDFKGDLARWQIISKIPTKDMRAKVMQARRASDPTYEDYLAGQDLVQACGRIQRDFDDWGETLLVDDSWSWFGRKASEHLPRWFKVRREEQVPAPLEPKFN